MRVFQLNERDIDSLRFSPDGRHLAVWSLGRVDVLDTDTGERRALRTERDSTFWDPPGIGFTPDGTGVIAVHRPDASRSVLIRIYDIVSGSTRWESPRARTGSADIAHDGRRAYTALLRPPNDASEIVAWDLVNLRRGPVIGRHSQQLYQLAVSPDGGWLAGRDALELLVWQIGADGALSPPRYFVGPRKSGSCDLALSAGGEFLAYRKSRGTDADTNRLWVWNVRTGEGGEVGPASGENTRALAFHPTRPLLAYVARKEIVFWDAAARTELVPYDWGIDAFRWCVCFSVDGLRCAAGSSSSGQTGQIVVWDVDA